MSYKPGDPYYKEFVTCNPTTGAAQNGDSLPTATADFSGSGTGSMSLTVTNLATGRYQAAGTIPGTRVKGDVLCVSVAATVASVAGVGVIDGQVIDSKRVGDLNDLGGTAQTGDSFARLGAPAGASIAADIAEANADLDELITTIGVAGAGLTGVTVSTNNDKTGYTLSSAGLDAVMIETGVNARQAVSVILASAAGVLSGAATTAIVIKGGNVSNQRIAATVDSDGNRSAVTLTLP